MRCILLIVTVLFTLGAFAALGERPLAEPTAQPAAAEPVYWVRTTDGWEHRTAWQAPPRLAPKLQPTVVAGFLAIASVASLVAASPGAPRNQG